MKILQPDILLHRVTDITPELLRELHVRGLVLDVDNTLAMDKDQTPLPGIERWIAQMKAGGIALTILSNNSAARVSPFAGRLGLPFVSRAAKPLCFGYLRAAGSLCLPRRQTAIVGDQIFTDILGGNLAGLRSILVEPIRPETGWSFRVRRHFEAGVIDKYRRRCEK